MEYAIYSLITLLLSNGPPRWKFTNGENSFDTLSLFAIISIKSLHK